ncbi:MAG TPA: hypothetical protein VNG33_22585 [Polyangiaceae bacterium]|nr:hypothetical protein [Polyangiaceae bacterium]
MKRSSSTLCLLAVAGCLTCISATAWATPGNGNGHEKGGGIAVPEIGGKHAATALALLVGGAAVILGRRRRSNKVA